MTDSPTLSSLDQHFADFICRIDSNPSDALWLAAALTSHSVQQGHTCLELADSSGKPIIPAFPASRLLTPPAFAIWLDTLIACDTIGDPGDKTPLIMDGPGRLYLHRSWQYEQQIAAGILSRSAALPTDRDRLEAALDRYFPANGNEPDLQRAAASAALTRRFSVISGGPGTGKTSTVARILALTIELAETKPPLIALAAPTGKAAMRLRQSILSACERLALPDNVSALMPRDVGTIHRLLGVLPDHRGYRHNRTNHLACDLLVVDEASMVDLPLMAHLLAALRDNARVILLGDRDQLASVEAGAVLADICAEAVAGPQRQEVCVTQLTRSYRFDSHSGIGELSRLINNGDADAAFELITSGAYEDVIWRQLPTGREFDSAFVAAARLGFTDYLGATTPSAALVALDRFRVLSPHREGLQGIGNLNRLCETGLGLHGKKDSTEYRLKPLMISGNNYELELFNGDTAVLLDDGDSNRLAAWFSDGDGGVRRLSPLRLPPHETAFALTVHKSQGSEYAQVLLILPEQASEVLTRELLYTAITRGKKRVEIWGTEEVFRTAVERRTERSSGLRERLVR